MAEEKTKEKPIQETINEHHRKMSSEIFFTITAIIVLMLLLNGIATTLGINKLFSNGFSWKSLTPKGLALSGTRPLASVLNPINGRVLVSNENGTDVYDRPGGKKIGSHKYGDYGRVLKGPVVIDGERYFYVDFEDGVDGWVKEADLNYKDPTIRKLKSSDPLGSSVLTSGDTNVLDSPGGKNIGSQPKGAKGFVTQGPIEKDGKKYWFVDFESGPDGWVEEGKLSLYNDGARRLSSKDGVGTEVVSARDGTGLYDEGGSLIGTVENGVNGKIKKGPKYINGEKYWFVEYENGQSGWVKDSDLRVLTKREKSGGEKIAFIISIIFKIFKFILFVLSFVLFVWIVKLIKQLTAIRENIKAKLFPNSLSKEKAEINVNPKWQRVLTHTESVNQSDWRLAILEADIMLDEMLTVMSLHGDTVADKLKMVEKSDFLTLDLAWEAHKIRNKIAHNGGDFILTQREARRVIYLYQKVFEEFDFI